MLNDMNNPSMRAAPIAYAIRILWSLSGNERMRLPVAAKKARARDWALVATVTYSGAKGTHQAQEFIPNSAPPGTKPACASCPTNFYYMTSGANTIANNFGQIQSKGGTNNGFPRQFQAKLRFSF